jgi:tyrosine-specific transport protein
MTIGKFFGSILLIIGTSIGGGMLALPVATASGGFFWSAICFIVCWTIMTSGALLILECLQPLPLGSNMISMARHYLGRPGELAIWFLYFALLYSLLGAYISGGSDVLSNILQQVHILLPSSLIPCIYTLSFSLIIYSGIKWVDYVNRGLMFGKLGAYLLLILVITPFVVSSHFTHGHLKNLLPNFSILVTSFGFASIVPSLRDYWHNDIRSLKKIIIFGSLVPLVCYLIWNFVIMGAISPDSPHNLEKLMHSSHAISGLGQGLGETTHNHLILKLFDLFSAVCMLTAFLSVSLGLFDFIADGFHLKKTGKQGLITLALTFFPPLFMVILNPGIYLKALNYAGIFCVMLLLLLPILMTWRARKIKPDNQALIPGEKLTLIFLLLAALFSIVIPYASYS